MIRRLAALAGALLLATGAPAPAQQVVNGGTAPNAQQRRAILDALRPPIQQRLGGPVEFVVQTIRVQGGWALVIALPQRPGAREIDGRRYFPADEWDVMDGLTVNGILRFSNGRWRLVDHAIGPSDVWYCGVDGPPRSLTGC